MPDDTTSTGAGATPPLVPPATGTPAAAGVTPQPPPSTLEEALKRVAELEHSQNNAKEEVERHRKNAKKLAELEAAEAARQQASLSEQEKQQKAQVDLQTRNEEMAGQLLELRVHQEVARHTGKLNFILSPDLIAKLLDWEEIEFDEASAKPTNIEKLLEKLAKAAPELVKPAQATQDTRPPMTPAMNPGRSSITQPGAQPGKIPTLDEYFRSHK